MARRLVIEIDLPEDGSRDDRVPRILRAIVKTIQVETCRETPVRGWGDLPSTTLKGYWGFKENI